MSEEKFVKSAEKAVKTLCRLSPSRCASARCLKLKNGRNITVISTGNELIYVLEDHKMEVRFFNMISFTTSYMSWCYETWSLEVILTVVITGRQIPGKISASLNLSEVSKLKLRQKSFNVIFQRIVNVHSPVIKVLHHIDVDENIWIITKDGKLWVISLTQSVQMEQLSTEC